MTTTATQTNAIEIARVATGAYLDDAATPDAASITLGFTPRLILVDNVTDRIKLTWYEGMTSAHAVKDVAAGTRTLETSGGVTQSGKTFGFAVTQNKQYRWVAFG